MTYMQTTPWMASMNVMIPNLKGPEVRQMPHFLVRIGPLDMTALLQVSLTQLSLTQSYVLILASLNWSLGRLMLPRIFASPGKQVHSYISNAHLWKGGIHVPEDGHRRCEQRWWHSEVNAPAFEEVVCFACGGIVSNYAGQGMLNMSSGIWVYSGDVVVNIA